MAVFKKMGVLTILLTHCHAQNHVSSLHQLTSAAHHPPAHHSRHRPPPAAGLEAGNFREVGDSHFRNFDSEKRDRKIWRVGGKHQNNNW